MFLEMVVIVSSGFIDNVHFRLKHAYISPEITEVEIFDRFNGSIKVIPMILISYGRGFKRVPPIIGYLGRIFKYASFDRFDGSVHHRLFRGHHGYDVTLWEGLKGRSL